MADVHNKKTRSYKMSQIKATNTKPEMLVRKFLHASGFRYKLHDKTLPGKPDIVLPKYKTSIFIHGCFWHGHDWHFFTIPQTRRDFWVTKISANQQRDQRNVHALRSAGWRVIYVWECALRGRLKWDADTLGEHLSKLIKKGATDTGSLSIRHL